MQKRFIFYVMTLGALMGCASSNSRHIASWGESDVSSLKVGDKVLRRCALTITVEKILDLQNGAVRTTWADGSQLEPPACFRPYVRQEFLELPNGMVVRRGDKVLVNHGYTRNIEIVTDLASDLIKTNLTDEYHVPDQIRPIE